MKKQKVPKVAPGFRVEVKTGPRPPAPIGPKDLGEIPEALSPKEKCVSERYLHWAITISLAVGLGCGFLIGAK